MRHRERLRRLKPDTEGTRTLQFLVEARRTFVNEKTRYSNRLTACLKMYFPQVLNWFSEVSSEIVGDFLQRWPTLEDLQKTRAERLRKFSFSTTVPKAIVSSGAWKKSGELYRRPTMQLSWWPVLPPQQR